MKFLDSSHINKSGTARRCNLELFVLKPDKKEDQTLILALLDDKHIRFLVNLNDREELMAFVEELYLFLDQYQQVR